MKLALSIAAYFAMTSMVRRKYHCLLFQSQLQRLEVALRMIAIHPFGPSLLHHLEQVTETPLHAQSANTQYPTKRATERTRRTDDNDMQVSYFCSLGRNTSRGRWRYTESKIWGSKLPWFNTENDLVPQQLPVLHLEYTPAPNSHPFGWAKRSRVISAASRYPHNMKLLPRSAS